MAAMGLRLRVAMDFAPAHAVDGTGCGAVERGPGIHRACGARASRATAGGDWRDRTRLFHRLHGVLADSRDMASARWRDCRARAGMGTIYYLCKAQGVMYSSIFR